MSPPLPDATPRGVVACSACKQRGVVREYSYRLRPCPQCRGYGHTLAVGDDGAPNARVMGGALGVAALVVLAMVVVV